jgi:glycerol-3-phosphate dehydrogenase (NAD(P)+)
MRRVTILGAGSWGTALAVHLGRVGHDVKLWARDSSLASDIEKRRANAVYLPDISLPDSVTVTDRMAEALVDTELIVSAIPSHGCRAVMRIAAPFISSRATIVSATKGLEAETLLRMSEVIAEELAAGPSVVVLSGPSFAIEVAQQLPTAVLAASTDPRAIEMVQSEFRSAYFRLYGSADVVGVELVGALKNIIAIAAGGRGRIGTGAQRAGGVDHARAGGDLQTCRRRGRSPRNAVGTQRTRGSGADVHGLTEPQSSRGD